MRNKMKVYSKKERERMTKMKKKNTISTVKMKYLIYFRSIKKK